MAITVFLADDNLIVREGFTSLLELEEDIRVVGQGADYDELVTGVDATEPQVIAPTPSSTVVAPITPPPQ